MSDDGWKDHVQFWIYENHGTWLEDEYLCLVAVATFFRRSGCYISLYENRELNINELFKQYCGAFEERTVQTTYLAAIANYTFAGEPMDFGEFKIQPIAEQEFDRIMHNEVRKYFYPESLIDSQLLEDYWFIVSTEVSDYLSWASYEWSPHDQMGLKVSSYPVALESVLKILALYHWSSGEMREAMEPELLLAAILEDEEAVRKLRGDADLPPKVIPSFKLVFAQFVCLDLFL